MSRSFLSADGNLARDSYKIIYTCVAVKSRCVTGIGYIA